MQLNPFLAHELRGRWRGGRAFLILGGFASILALVMGWQVLDSYSLTSGTPNGILVNSRLAQLGHQLFSSLAWVQVIGWLLVAPALTSSAIAAEREDGSLEHLLLCPLSPRAIIAGKLGAALCFAAILLVSTLPLAAIIMLLGGVSPGEFGAVWALQSGTALVGATVGIMVSAWQLRANAALRISYACLVGWLVISVGGIAVNAPGMWAATGNSVPLGWQIYAFFGLTNPVYAAFTVTEFAPGRALFSTAPWLVCLGFELAASLALWMIAALGVRKPLAQAEWLERSKRKKQGVGSHLEVPLLARMAGFSSPNPVLGREVRGKFRLRRPGLIMLFIEAVLGIIVAGFYLYVAYWAWFDPSTRDSIWWVLAFVVLGVLMLSCAAMGAHGFARERESGTWEGVRLSLLLPGEILSGKVGGALIACAIFSLPVWPLMLPCLNWLAPLNWQHNSPASVQLWQALATLVIWGMTALCYTLWGLWMSWRCRKSSAAVGWTLGSLFATLIFVPLLIGMSGAGEEQWLFAATNPLIALGMVASNDSASHGAWASAWENTGLPFALVAGMVSVLLWNALSAEMEMEARE